jgi:hypothetical protein
MTSTTTPSPAPEPRAGLPTDIRTYWVHKVGALPKRIGWQLLTRTQGDALVTAGSAVNPYKVGKLPYIDRSALFMIDNTVPERPTPEPEPTPAPSPAPTPAPSPAPTPAPSPAPTEPPAPTPAPPARAR